jgi:hypothetical protein
MKTEQIRVAKYMATHGFKLPRGATTNPNTAALATMLVTIRKIKRGRASND